MAISPGLDYSDEVNELQHLQDVQSMYTGAKVLQVLLKLTTIEKLCWMFGMRPSRREMAERLFHFIDKNGNGKIAISSMDLLVKMLAGQLPFSKASFDHLEVGTSCFVSLQHLT